MRFHLEEPKTAWLDVPLPAPWQGLFQALGSQRCPDKKADIWFSESTDSGYGHQPAWSTLLGSMTVLEPYITQDTQQLSFKPRLLHLSSDTQVGFLQFLCRHINRIADSEIQTFVDKLRPHLLSDSPALAQLIVLQWSIKSADEQNDVIKSPEKITGELKEQAVEQPAETRKVTETGDITHQDDVIVIDLDSDEDAPKPKRQRLDNFNPATDQDANINSNSREIINTAEEMICDNSNNKVTNNENSVDSSNFIEQDAVDNSLENVTTKSVQHIEDKTEIELSQDKEEAIGRLKEIWHSANTSETCPAQELESLVSLTSEEMETAVKKLELTEMNENSVLTACSHLASVSELISYGNCVCFLRFALCEKVVTLTQNASRVLVSAVTMVANRYPKQLIDSVLVRCVVGSFDSPHLDLVTRLLKESFNEGTQLYFMKSFIADQELEINDSKIALIQTLLETTNIDPEIIEKILNLFERQTSKLAKNLKFGKLLLAVVTKHGKLLRGENLIKFSSIVDKHQTFVKKSVENAVKKLKS